MHIGLWLDYGKLLLLCPSFLLLRQPVPSEFRQETDRIVIFLTLNIAVMYHMDALFAQVAALLPAGCGERPCPPPPNVSNSYAAEYKCAPNLFTEVWRAFVVVLVLLIIY